MNGCGIYHIIENLEKLNVHPFTPEKCLIANLAVVMTSMWEANTKNAGNTLNFIVFKWKEPPT